MKLLQPNWAAFGAAMLAIAVFWGAPQIIDKVGCQAPLGATEPLVFLIIFFLGMLMEPRN